MKTAFLKHGILLAALFASGSMVYAQKGFKSRHSSSNHVNGNQYINIYEDSSENPVQTFITYKNGQEKYEFTLALDKVTALNVNDRKIPADSFYLYNGIIDKLKEQIKKDKAQAEEDRKQAALDRKQAEKDQLQAEKDRAQATLDMANAEEDRKQADQDRLQAKKDQAQAEKDRAQAELDRKQAMRDMEQSKKDRQQALKDREQAVKDRAQAVKDRAQAELDRKQAEEDRAMMKSLIEELVKDNIITDEKSLSRLVLNKDELTVNGKKQPEELHAKYKAKFLKKPGFSISYGNTSGYGVYE